MGLIWIPGLATGVEWQDKQHRELFAKINALIECMSLNKGKDEMAALFKFLDDYVRVHFRREEDAMDRFKYVAAAMHKAQHQKFIDNLSYLRVEFSKESAHKHVIEARKLLAEWFFEHIQKIDKNLGVYLLREQQKNQKEASNGAGVVTKSVCRK